MFSVPPRHVAAVERAALALAARFPQHVPGRQDGWGIQTRSGRPIAVWDLKEKIAADTPEQDAKRLELAQALAATGLAVTVPGHMYVVFFAEPPADPTGLRYTVTHDDSVLGSLLGSPYLVMDTFTGVDVATAYTPERAKERCAEFTRAQNELDAQVTAGFLPAGSHATPNTTTE
ncbi:hypothetical protein [Streptomyces sp. 7N604]|uniref:hypothetical protein n=1 Tax=Streptomyces sp. 7N604 TaxID=3457415 RepID=UPI003FD45ECD